MSASQTFGFAKLVPGFDFLQNLAKHSAGGSNSASGMPPMTPLSNWIAPTLNVEELDKRIQELRAVHFWLEQNGKALAATIQALEVQKMTLSTLQGMNLSMSELAESLKLRPEAAAAAAAPSFRPAPDDSDTPAPSPRAGSKAGAQPSRKTAAPANADPMQWWGSLSEQFRQIAETALQDVAQAGASGSSPAPARKSTPTAKPSGKAPAAKKAAAAKPVTAAKARKSADPLKPPRAAPARPRR